MLHRRLYHSEIFRESHHGLSGIPLGQSRDEINFHATSKAGFYKGAGQDDARITFQMTVAGGRAASRKCLDANLN
jgi:hypothetical protein